MCRVVVCRGCCCGTHTKHPGVDHAAQLATLQAIPADAAAVTVSGCLSNCDYGNTIVVIPSPTGRARGGRPVWLGHMLTPAATAAVSEWVCAGGPGVAAMPPALAAHHLTVIRPPELEHASRESPVYR